MTPVVLEYFSSLGIALVRYQLDGVEKVVTVQAFKKRYEK